MNINKLSGSKLMVSEFISHQWPYAINKSFKKMTIYSLYGFLFAALGLSSLYIGIKWKSPSYKKGIVNQYGLILLGITLILASILSFLKLF
jgi:hypothetical protein